MSFLTNVISEFTGGGQSQHNIPPPPQVPYPWRAIWDQRDGRYIFENEQTGQRTWDLPGGMMQERGYGQGGYGQSGGYVQGDRPQQQNHYGEMALAGAAGLAGGALLMHEGEKIHDDYDYDKYRVENAAGRLENDVEDFPENAARWTGQEVQKVEDIPEDVAGWAGRKVGDVERFGDRVEGSYDYGRDEQRYGDDQYAYGGDRRDDGYGKDDSYVQQTETYQRDDYRRDDGYGRDDTYDDRVTVTDTYTEGDRRW